MALDNGLSIADAMALARDNDGNFSEDFLWIFFLFFLMSGNGWNRNDMVTKSDLCEGFNFNDLQRQLLGVQNGLCDGFYAVNTSLLNGFHGIDNGLAHLGYQMSNCCCETNRNIDAVRYEASQHTCEITNAIHAEGEATRALINANTMQDLRDKLQAAQFQLSQVNQNAYLVDQLRPCARPAYITCSPYQTANPCCGNVNGF